MDAKGNPTTEIVQIESGDTENFTKEVKNPNNLNINYEPGGPWTFVKCSDRELCNCMRCSENTIGDPCPIALARPVERR